MEEAFRLMTVQRDVGRIQIEHHLAGHHRMRLDVEVYQQPVNGLSRVTDLVITLAAPSQFQPVQRTLARQRLFQLPLAAQHSQQRIGAQLLVIVQILVAKRQPVNPLREHLRQLVLDLILIAAIAKAARQTPQQVDLPVRLAQQQRPAVARHLAGCEPGFNPARKMGCKCKRFLVTLCHQKGRLSSAITTSRQRSYAMKRRPFQAFFYPSLPLSQMPL